MSCKRNPWSLGTVLAFLCFALMPFAAAADPAYPSRPLTLVIGFPPGGATDLTGRVIAEMLRDQLKQPVIVANRPGAAGVTGAAFVAKSAPDGYTLMWSPEFDTTTRALIDGETLKFSTADLKPVGGTATSPYYLIVKGDSRWKTLDELIDYGRKNPGKLTYSSAGIGMINNVGLELFLRRMGIDALHVPHKGGAEALNAVLGGVVDMHMSSGGRLKPFIEAGSIRALVNFSGRRADTPPFGDIPSLAEKGLAMPDLTLFNYLSVAKDTPPDILARLEKSFKDGLADPAYAERLTKLLYSPRYIAGDEVTAMQREYVKEMRGIVDSVKQGQGK